MSADVRENATAVQFVQLHGGCEGECRRKCKTNAIEPPSRKGRLRTDAESAKKIQRKDGEKRLGRTTLRVHSTPPQPLPVVTGRALKAFMAHFNDAIAITLVSTV